MTLWHCDHQNKVELWTPVMKVDGVRRQQRLYVTGSKTFLDNLILTNFSHTKIKFSPEREDICWIYLQLAEPLKCLIGDLKYFSTAQLRPRPWVEVVMKNLVCLWHDGEKWDDDIIMNGNIRRLTSKSFNTDGRAYLRIRSPENTNERQRNKNELLEMNWISGKDLL